MGNLIDIVRDEVGWYAAQGRGLNMRLFRIFDEEHQVYAVVAVRYPERKAPAGVVVMARVDGDRVIVEEDRTDKPLVEHLMQAGVPREKIILAYAGEAYPDPFPQPEPASSV